MESLSNTMSCLPRRLPTFCLPVLLLSLGLPGLTPAADAGDERAADPKPRVVVLTDITNEPDDAMSLVRFLCYADLFDIEGLIATTSCWKRDRPNLGAVLELLDAYEAVYPNLCLHSPDYPSAEALRAVALAGVEGYGMGPAGTSSTMLRSI